MYITICMFGACFYYVRRSFVYLSLDFFDFFVYVLSKQKWKGKSKTKHS